jgi:hypothetical protein
MSLIWASCEVAVVLDRYETKLIHPTFSLDPQFKVYSKSFQDVRTYVLFVQRMRLINTFFLNMWQPNLCEEVVLTYLDKMWRLLVLNFPNTWTVLKLC